MARKLNATRTNTQVCFLAASSRLNYVQNKQNSEMVLCYMVLLKLKLNHIDMLFNSHSF